MPSSLDVFAGNLPRWAIRTSCPGCCRFGIIFPVSHLFAEKYFCWGKQSWPSFSTDIVDVQKKDTTQKTAPVFNFLLLLVYEYRSMNCGCSVAVVTAWIFPQTGMITVFLPDGRSYVPGCIPGFVEGDFCSSLGDPPCGQPFLGNIL